MERNEKGKTQIAAVARVLLAQIRHKQRKPSLEVLKADIQVGDPKHSRGTSR